MSTYQKLNSTILYTNYLEAPLDEDTIILAQCKDARLMGNDVYVGLQNDNNEFIGKCNLSLFTNTSIDCEEGDDWKLTLEDVDDTNTAVKLMYSGSIPDSTTTRTFNIKTINGKELFVTLNILVLDSTPIEPTGTLVYINRFELSSATDIYLITTNHGDSINWAGGYVMVAWQPTTAMLASGHSGPIGFYYTNASNTLDIEYCNLIELTSGTNKKLTYTSGTQYGTSSGGTSNFSIFNISSHVYKDFDNDDQSITDSTTIYVYYHKLINGLASTTLYLAGSFKRKSGGCYTYISDTSSKTEHI